MEMPSLTDEFKHFCNRYFTFIDEEKDAIFVHVLFKTIFLSFNTSATFILLSIDPSGLLKFYVSKYGYSNTQVTFNTMVGRH